MFTSKLNSLATPIQDHSKSWANRGQGKSRGGGGRTRRVKDLYKEMQPVTSTL